MLATGYTKQLSLIVYRFFVTRTGSSVAENLALEAIIVNDEMSFSGRDEGIGV